jgi:hypothetical protein
LPANTAFNCSIAKPCRAFSEAIGVTTAGGEVIVLDSAGYGPVTIAQSVSLITPTGVYAGVSVPGGDGIVVNAPGATVVLRGLTINGQGGATGINIQQAAKIRIEGCSVSNMTGNGVLHAALATDVIILDTIVRDNAGNGISITADASVTLDHVRSERNGSNGFYIVPSASETRATIARSLFVSNALSGVSADTTANSDHVHRRRRFSALRQRPARFQRQCQIQFASVRDGDASTHTPQCEPRRRIRLDPATSCPPTACTANGVLTGNSTPAMVCWPSRR